MMLADKQDHIPVMLNEVLTYLQPKVEQSYIDATFGAGGYARAILEAANCKLYAIDRDPNVQASAEKMQEQYQGRFHFIQGAFADQQLILSKFAENSIDGMVFDLGVSSMQLDQAERGFSFNKEARLDMRMGPDGKDAHWLVNHGKEEDLANIIYNYGEERAARKIAAKIVQERAKQPIDTTKQLAEIIKSVIGRYGGKIDPATKSFQAIRIWVNDELEQLAQGLELASRLLKDGGRLVIVSFHALEDRIVKKFLNEQSGKNQSISRYQPLTSVPKLANFELLTNHSIKPTPEEISNNIRSRSARLRAAKRVRKS